MPLDREHITVASRIMLPTYVVLFLGLGLGSTVTPMHRLLATPFFRYADHLMSMRAWGALFIACGLLMLTALIKGNRTLYRWALLVCGLSMLVWAVVALVGVWFQPISFSAWLWPAFAAACTWATNKSLERGERDLRTEH